jgi:hypothetical protein
MMSPNPNATNVKSGELTNGEIVDKIEELLKGVSNNRTQSILKMVGIVHNVRFVPAFAPVPGPNVAPPGRDTRGQRNSRIRSKTNPEIKATRSQIKDLNLKISKKSSELGGVQLPKDDELIVKRNQLFRDLKEAQNKDAESAQESSQKEAQGAQARNARGDPSGSPSQRI